MRTAEHFIPLAVPHLGGNAWAYVKECLDTEWVSYAGSYVDRFERELAAAAGAGHAVAMNAGTSALHVALLLAGVQADDEVVMPAVSFVAPANAVRYCKAWPTFVDISRNDWQLDCDRLEEFLREGCERKAGQLVNCKTGRRIAALMPVHLLGGMADVDRLCALAESFGLPLIEDAAECLGARYKGRAIGAPPPGARPPSRVVCTSFNGNKIITTGGGGALLCEDQQLASRAKHLSTTAKTDPVEFIHDEVGYNYRLTNLAAALGVAQLEMLDEHVASKRALAGRYARLLGGIEGIRCMPEPARQESTFWMYTVELPCDAMPIVKRLNELGIQARPLWRVLPELTPFARDSFVAGADEARRLCRNAVSLPCSVGLAEENQAKVAEALIEILNAERAGRGSASA